MGGKYTKLDIRTFSIPALDGDVLRLAHVQGRTTPGNQDPAGSRCCHWLEMDLLDVDYMLVIEGNIFGIQLILDGVVQGIWGLR